MQMPGDLSWSLRDRARGFPGYTEEEPGPDRALGGLLGVEVMGWTLCLNPGLTFFLRQPLKSCPRLSFESYPSAKDRGGLPWFFADRVHCVP